jgi:hypothetical protein
MVSLIDELPPKESVMNSLLAEQQTDAGILEPCFSIDTIAGSTTLH